MRGSRRRSGVGALIAALTLAGCFALPALARAQSVPTPYYVPDVTEVDESAAGPHPLRASGDSPRRLENRRRELPVDLDVHEMPLDLADEPIPQQIPGEMPEPPQSAREQDPLAVDPQAGEIIAAIEVTGNETIETQAILNKLKSTPGREWNDGAVRQDRRVLWETKWFWRIVIRYRRTDKGLVMILDVVERPVVERVEYRGNKGIKEQFLSAHTGLKVGSPFDVHTNRDAARRLEDEYKEKGYPFAKVKLFKGGSRDDREVIFDINEGPKVKVTRRIFHGNKDVSGPVLKTKLQTKPAILGVFGGKYNPETIPNDIDALKEYYHALGYFDVQVEERVSFHKAMKMPWNKNGSNAHIEYVVDEGRRYKVRDIEMGGNTIYTQKDLLSESEMLAGDFFNARFLNKDLTRIKDRYGKLGRIYAKVEAEPRFLPEPGIVDIVYHIDEDRVFYVRRVDVNYQGDYPHTKRSVALNNALIHPGDLADPALIRKTETRLAGSGYFQRGGNNDVKIDITVVEPEDLFHEEFDEMEIVRGQSGELVRPAPEETHPRTDKVRDRTSRLPKGAVRGPSGEYLRDPREDEERENSTSIIRGQSGDLIAQSDPFDPRNQVSPQGDPYASALQGQPPGFVDININASEAQTGRFMFGVGVNSDAGVVGNIVLSEDNFDILRPPSSFADVINGRAFRGGGQKFRMEAIPGSVVSRYMVNWTDPFFMDSQYSLGLSGFFYNRYFDDWQEQRAGGRVTVGRQLDQFTSVTGALRLEQVDITDPEVPTPQILTDALGTSFLSTARIAGVYDTRDSAFLAGEGHRLELSYEQAFGDFNYPRIEADARKFFTIFSRPDGGGRHILTVGGQVGWTDSDTPIFERFFAGGFQTFRGFAFRGVTPREFDVGIGGEFMALGTVEYMLPVLADESVQFVTFTDFGSVEEDVTLENFRLSVGAGVRLTIPAMGPVPLAFDWAVPLLKEDFDDTRVFSFTVGFNY